MAFSTACLKSAPDLLRRWLALLVLVPALVWAAEIDIANPQLSAGDDGYVLSADFKLELNPRLEEAVTKGLILHFVADFELSKARWYWLDEKLVSRSQTYRLSYHALTRQYRLSTGGLHQSFQTLSEATQVLSRLRNWTVIDKGEKSVRAGDPYQAALRMRLDVTQLPRPFQITALGNKDWSLGSDWKTWQATLPPFAAPAEAK
ncbi:MAG: putative proline rich signal peptide protein [Proteobacteria bacterium]|nr:putative proline rich signal peptide protein [Pseudomonadota bacterium]